MSLNGLQDKVTMTLQKQMVIEPMTDKTTIQRMNNYPAYNSRSIRPLRTTTQTAI